MDGRSHPESPEDKTPDVALASLVSTHFGELGAWSELGSREGGTRVFRVQRPKAPDLVVRSHRSSRKFARETAAHDNWGPLLSGRLAPLLHADAKALFLVLPWLEGQVVAASTDREQLLEAQRLAGQLARDLHAISQQDTDTTSIEEALAMRMRRALQLAATALPSTLADRAAGCFAGGGPLAGLSRVPCHRDYEPRNWIIDTAAAGVPGLFAIDLEHAGMDLWLADLVKLAVGPWLNGPGLMEQFLVGYEYPSARLSREDDERLEALLALHGIATVAWGARNTNERVVSEGLGILEALS